MLTRNELSVHLIYKYIHMSFCSMTDRPTDPRSHKLDAHSIGNFQKKSLVCISGIAAKKIMFPLYTDQM